MYTEEQIRILVTEKIEIFKKATAKKEVPEYTDVYKESIEYADRIAVHSEIGKFPDKLFRKRAPNQSPEEFDYMKANYKTTTFPIWAKFSGVLNRIWNDQNWSIVWPEGSDEARQYVETDYPTYDSLEAYFKSIVTKLKEKDANAVLCIKPKELPIIQAEDGSYKVDESKEIDPIAIIYASIQVLSYNEDHTLIELNEKSIVQYGQTTRKNGKIFEFYDDQNIWRVTQTGKETDYTFDYTIYWPHQRGYLPAKKLKGIPVQKETTVLYQSHFMSAIEPMDLVLLDSSYLQAAKAGHAFPHKWEYFDECDYGNVSGACVGGKVYVDGNETDCPSCHGTGRKRQGTVLGVTQVKAPNITDDSSKEIAIPPMGWVAPDSQILEFLRTEIGFNSNQALSILNLMTSNSDVKGSDTALGKQIDREELFSFLLSISNDLFNLYEFTNNAIIEMRYGEIDLPALSYPKNFSIRNESDLTMEIADAKKNGLPDIAIRKLLEEYVRTRFSAQSQDKTAKVVDLAFYSDRLVTLTPLEIASKKLSGSVANWEDILHTSVYNFIEVLATDPKFFEKSIEDQKAALIQMAKDKDLEISPKKMNTDKILAGANA